MKKLNLRSFLRYLTRNKAGFTLMEAMVAILILTVGLLGVGYGLHVSYKIDNDSIGLLSRTENNKKVGLRDVFNDGQLSVYGTLK